MQLTQYYRTFDLPWDVDPDEQQRFRRYLRVGLGVLLFLGLVLPLVHLPKRAVSAEEAVPPRLARLMEQERPKPPPPKPVEQPKEKPKVQPQPTPKPVDTRKKMANSAAMRAIKDELADLRDQLDTTALQNHQLTSAVSQDPRSERSLIASKVGTGSAGIVTANSSRGFGSGAGALSDHNTTAVNSRIAADAAQNRSTRNGGGGKAARSSEEIALMFDRNKGAIYALYGRALRERADLQGKLVLQLTISPAGEVTDCHVISSELGDPDLERKIVARVRLFRFDAKDVGTAEVTKRLDFFPIDLSGP
ncbi:MAG TPA: TonB family protein [Steroidobacteraceae bacterium]|nr:TonB family protein [Steroidobacteraceae bacterium]